MDKKLRQGLLCVTGETYFKYKNTVQGGGKIHQANADGRKLKEPYDLQTERTANRKNAQEQRERYPAMEPSILRCMRALSVYVPGRSVRTRGTPAGPRGGRDGPAVRADLATSRGNGWSCGRKISENTVELSSAIHHPGLIDVYRTLRPPTQNTYSPQARRRHRPG